MTSSCPTCNMQVGQDEVMSAQKRTPICKVNMDWVTYIGAKRQVAASHVHEGGQEDWAKGHDNCCHA